MQIMEIKCLNWITVSGGGKFETSWGSMRHRWCGGFSPLLSDDKGREANQLQRPRAATRLHPGFTANISESLSHERVLPPRCRPALLHGSCLHPSLRSLARLLKIPRCCHPGKSQCLDPEHTHTLARPAWPSLSKLFPQLKLTFLAGWQTLKTEEGKWFWVLRAKLFFVLPAAGLSNSNSMLPTSGSFFLLLSLLFFSQNHLFIFQMFFLLCKT